ncbi:MAG: response regulator [Bacteroidota bacterium]|nr:response regulator [Bacteroidota bacterium]
MTDLKALIIDDEEDICFLMTDMLNSLDFQASSTNHLKDAFELIALNDYSVVFLDINLNDGSGLEAIKKIKSTSPKTTVIMISAFDGSAERGIASQRGADFFIGKPLTKEKIVQALTETHLLNPRAD